MIGVGPLSAGVVFVSQQQSPYTENEDSSGENIETEVSANENISEMEELSMNNEQEEIDAAEDEIEEMHDRMLSKYTENY